MGKSVVFSLAVAKNSRVYHKADCIYAKRIKKENRNRIRIGKIEDPDPRFCRYCGGLAGEMRIWKTFLEKKYKNHMKLFYDPHTDTLYISTEIGFWKIFLKKGHSRYLLYHRNGFCKEMAREKAIHGEFHHQGDVSPSRSIDHLLEYIRDHDISKQIIADDYRKLPQKTEKQKMYYRIAERNARRKQANRLDRIFEELEKQNGEEYRKLACW